MWVLPEGRPALMGILNVTPDSFSEKGQNFYKSSAIESAIRMVDEGADLLDVGGESTRPGAEPVSIDEEIRRVIPVIESIVGLGIPISVDTRKSQVARLALASGAFLVNDVTALEEEEMMAVCVEAGCHVCLMHMKGQPTTMQDSPKYGDVISEVDQFLLEKTAYAESMGISKDRIWVDPGIGFGKSVEHNLLLLNGLTKFVSRGYPVLVGVSRKSFIGKITGASVENRLSGTLASQVLAQAAGVRVIRAHDVAEARQAIDVAAAIIRPSSFSKHLA